MRIHEVQPGEEYTVLVRDLLRPQEFRSELFKVKGVVNGQVRVKPLNMPSTAVFVVVEDDSLRRGGYLAATTITTGGAFHVKEVPAKWLGIPKRNRRSW